MVNESIIYALPQSLTKIIAAFGGIVFLYLVFQIIFVILNKRRQKILELIRGDLKRLEKKIDTLKGIPKEGIPQRAREPATQARTSNEASERKRNNKHRLVYPSVRNSGAKK